MPQLKELAAVKHGFHKLTSRGSGGGGGYGIGLVHATAPPPVRARLASRALRYGRHTRRHRRFTRPPTLQPRKELSALSISTLAIPTRSLATIANAADKLVVAQNEVYSAKLAVFRAFCSSFDDTAKQFTSGPALQFAQKFSSSFLQYWTDVLAGTHTNLPPTKPSYATVVGAGRPAPTAAGTSANPVTAALQHQRQQQPAPRRQGQRNPLPPPIDDLWVFARLRPGQTADMSGSFAVRTHIADKLGIARSLIPQAHPCKTGWAIHTAELATGDLLTERQAEWAPDISAQIVEKRQEWYTYAVQGCPRRFNNIFGEAIDDEKAIRDEVATQTGQTPDRVITAKQDSDQRPTRTLIISFAKETNPPKQCDNCWDYHSRYSCGRQARCMSCGRIGHAQDTCTATEQCANCLGPHAVDFPQCPARLKKANGAFHSLNRSEKELVQVMGKRLFKQFTTKPASPLRQQSTSPKAESATASDNSSSSSRSTPTSSDASTPEPAMQNAAPRPSETAPGSFRSQSRVLLWSILVIM
ncbi:hypothetical protein Purlil1_12773 [Purpureocillium lilacinum]|uniref:CCHC-type domain-containing protein n=1 Tax=Purpureocillium lilacinum TaxID=33203 RepID=A0ABR0BFZ7_PURLI|nr:hypothetical protein Purlil1_12773 [Purpureocillium lilacinum]